MPWRSWARRCARAASREREEPANSKSSWSREAVRMRPASQGRGLTWTRSYRVSSGEGAAVSGRPSARFGRVNLDVAPALAVSPHPCDPAVGGANLSHRRHHLRAVPHPVEEAVAAGGDERLAEALAEVVLAHLERDPGQSEDQPLDQAALRLTPVEGRLQLVEVLDVVPSDPVHHQIAVALQHAHDRLEAADPAELAGDGDAHPAERLGGEAAGLGIARAIAQSRRDQPVHQEI